MKQRIPALFFVALFIFSANSASVLALSAPTGPTLSDFTNGMTSSHKTSTTPSIGKIPSDSPLAPVTLQSNQLAAYDAVPMTGINSTSNLVSLAQKPNNETLATPEQSKPIQPHELVNMRTATSSLFENKNGSLTQTNYFSPHYYQNNGSWQAIDTNLSADNNASDSGNVFGKALGDVESWFSSTPNAYIATGNSWQARFTPSNFSGGMVRIREGSSQMGFSPVNANVVNPIIATDSNGKQTVHYYNLWQGVDVEYTVESDQIEENIILNNKTSTSQMQFKVIGADLQRPTSTTSSSQDVKPAFNIDNALNNQFNIAPANLILNNFGFVDNSTSGLTQTYNNGVLTVSLNNSYMQKLPNQAFPAVIDPSVYTSTFGTRAGGNYVSFETNGTICYSNVCDLYAGSLYDSNNYLQYWRGAYYAPYNLFQSSGVVLSNADLHLTQLTGVSWWTGSTTTHNFQVGNATCLNSFNCLDGYWDSANIGTSGDVNVTNIYQNLINTKNWGGWLMVAGEDGTTSSFKSFDPDNSYVTFTYNYTIPSPSFITPSNGQVFVDPQASFALDSESNPNDSTPLQYEMMISDAPNGTGTVIDSGTPQNSTLWTVPDGVLQDGSTYYIQARSYDQSTEIYSPWSGSVEFKVDSREGRDSTQTSDTFGPVSVDLGTGNLSTSITSHTTTALAGDIGVNLSYNSPLKPSPGLVGSYWNQGSGSATSPQLQRIDQNVDFNWSSGTPGAPINPTYFDAEWDGYFVTPVTGSYNFGGINDDALAITVNGQQVYSNGGCYSGPCYGSSISLVAGQVVTFQATYNQVTGPDYAHIYVSGAVPQQVVPEAWFQTGVRAVTQNNGLVGHYYSYTDTGVPPALPTSSTNGAFLTRTDPLISFNWNGGSPIPNGPSTDFEVQWTGYLTAPVSGSYTFGTQSDDGSGLIINGQQVYNDWQDQSATQPLFGTAITLTAGQSVPIVVNYYQHLGGDSMALDVEAPGGTSSEVVPSSWLSPQAQVLPSGWAMGVDPDGNATYNHLTANQDNAILTDSSGDTHDYTWNGSSYVPPVNEYGHLVRNLDGSFTLQDSDGTTYVFNSSGTLTSMTNPVDDQHPAALQYSYGSVYSGGPVVLQKITDGVTANRYMAVYYSGASQCGTPPAGFSAAPANMLCAVQTNDGRTTYFYYDANGNLSRVAKPGNDNTDYQYQSVYNVLGQVVGYQLSGVRDDVANDAIAAGVRANDSTVFTEIGYDALGRVTSVTEPAATTGASQLENTIDYYIGATEEHVVGATEPAGYSERVEYDSLFRTTKVYNNQGLATTNVWDPEKDLLYSTTNPEGLMSTNIYDNEDRLVSQYGPAPATWFNTWSWTLGNGQELTEGQSLWSPDQRFQFTFQSDGNLVLYGPNGVMWSSGTNGQTATDVAMQSDGNLVMYNGNTPIWASNTAGDGSTTYLAVQNDGNAILFNSSGSVWETNTGGWAPSSTTSIYDTPLSSYTSQVAHTNTSYDQGMTGLGVAYMNVNESAPNEASLTGAPLLHSTNIASDGTINNNYGSSSPIPNVSSNWGFSMTGDMSLPTTGSWGIRIASDNGVRMWIDNILVIDDWQDGVLRSHPTYIFDNVTADSTHTVRIDYYHLTGAASFTLYMTPPGGNETDQGIASYFNPDYGLVTSTTMYDSTYGTTTTQTNYGTTPELGLVDSTTVDPSGLDLTTSNTYEAAGTGYFRQTSQTSPGGSTSNYAYYTANATVSNPCVSGSTAAYQGGMLETETDPSPDGGTTPGKSVTNVYDDAGNIVATETNQDGWECKTYDARDRLVQDTVPAYNGSPSQTTTYNYDVGGNSLVASITDSTGTITTTTDLLGRTVGYTDIYGDTTISSYDNLGRLTSENSPMGTKTYTYNNYNQLTDETLNGTDLAQSTYDAYGRLSSVNYPSASYLNESMSYNADTGSLTSETYNLGQPTSGSNLVPNPSFEQSTNGQPNDWNQGNWGTNTVNFSYANTGHTGSYSGRIDMTSYTSGDAKWYFNPVNITGNATYSFSDYYESNVDTDIVVQYSYANGSNTYQTIGYPAASSSGWAQATYSFTAPSTATQVTIFHLINSVGWLQIDDMSVQQTQTPITVSDTAAFTQSGKEQNDTVSSGSSNLSSNYTYDTADRLTTATIGSNTYSYGFGVQNSSCGVGSNMNSVSGNSSNRTSQTINGTTTTYCYNYADQLVSSSDPSESGDTYDSHGDLTRIGTGASLVRFYYDAEDRNTGIEQYDNNGNGYGMYYGRDPLGRIVGRYENNIANWNWTDSGNDINYDYSDSSDNPSYARSNYTWAITAEYVQLPGGVTVTIYPQQSSQASEYGYNLTNLHGDTFLTTDGTGSNTSSGTGPANAFIYDPFGNPISGNSDPANTDRASYGYEGRSLKITETDFTGTPIQMGARVYLPALGRFTTMDPVSGGNANTYMYPADPINHNDVSGQCIGPFILLLPACIMVLTAAVDYFGTGGGGGAVESGAADLSDQLVIQEVKSNPSVGEQIMKGSLKDPAFPETDGWAKMQYTHEPLTQNARRVTVHYFYNTTTKVVKNVKIMR